MQDLMPALTGPLDFPLFNIGATNVTVATLLVSLTIILLSVWTGRMLRHLVQRALGRRNARSDVAGTLGALVYYSVLAMGLGVALSTAGIELAALFAAGAVFAVGLGFALQSIAQNFVAGLILLTERAIKPGDMLELEGQLVRLGEMGVRSCVAQTRDGEDLIIPNSVLIQATVKNFTLRESSYRVWIPVGVVYGSDMTRVRATLMAAAVAVSAKWSSPKEPSVLLTEFGSSSVNWEVGVWINQPWDRRIAKSEVHEAIWFALKGEGIVIAFPQVDLHLDPVVTSSLTSLAGRAA